MTIDEAKYKLWVSELSKFIPASEVYEVLQEVLVRTLPKDIPDSELDNYVIASAYKSYYSTTSPYARNACKHLTIIGLENLDMADTLLPEIDKIDVIEYINSIKGISWWERQCFMRKIIEDKTFDELAEEYNISRSQVVYSYYKVKKILEDKIKNIYYE